MAKSKKYISSKVKRKFVVGGPYKDVEAELYNPNADRTIYQAADQPSTILQQQQEAMLQQQAAANKSMYQNQLNAELARNQAQQQQTANLIEEEKAARKAEEQKQKQALATKATKGATKLGKQAAKDFAISDYGMLGNSSNLFSSANIAAGAPLSPSAGVTASQMTFSNPAITSSAPLTMANYAPSTPSAVNAVMPQGLNQGVTMTSTGADAAASSASLGTAAAGIGLGLAGEGIGMYATYKQRKEDDAAKRSQYYRDADYTRREALGQIGKSTLKGAGIGVGAGTTLGLGVGSVPAAVVGGVIGGVAGLGYGVGKALHEERLTKSEADRGIKIGNKRIGKKLLFGDENVYSAAKDPYEIAKAQYQDSLEKQAQLASAMDTAALASRTTEANTGFNIKGGNMAKYGGSIEYLKGGIAKPLPRGAKEYVGKKHEQGGIDLPGNIEVEGGETEQNNYIFSATLKLPTGLTYAQAHKNLLASGASSEEIKQLALSQEAAAGRNPNEIKTMKFAKYGGPLMYKKGGVTDPPKEGELDFDAKTKMRIHANEGVGPEGLTTPYLDSKGYWTVGYGHLLTKPDGTPYTKNDTLPASAKEIPPSLIEFWGWSDYENLKDAAINWIGKDKWEELPDSVKSGIVELSYGVGPKGLEGFKNTKKFLIEGDYESAAENITNSKYFKDVKERRGTQVAALIGGDDEVFTKSASTNQYTVPKEKAIPYLTAGKQLQTTNTNKPSAIGVNPQTTMLPEGKEVDLGEDTGNTSGLTNIIDRKGLQYTTQTPEEELGIINRNAITYGGNPEEDIVNQVTDINTQKTTDLAPTDELSYIKGKDVTRGTGPTTNLSIKPYLNQNNNKSTKTPVVEVGPAEYEIIPNEDIKNTKKDKTKQTNISDPYKTLAYAAQFAQPAYALFNPYRSKYSEPGISISAPMAGVIPTVGTNINFGRVSAAAPIASLQAGTNAIIANAGNIAGPGGIAMQLAALEKLKSGSVAAQSAADTANIQLAAQEANAKLAASKSNQAATMQGIQLNTQVAAQNAQLQAARNAREAAAKEQARQEAYINTAGALGATGAGIGTMYRDQNQLDTQYKIALATDPTGSAARWLKENDPAAYNRYIQEGTTKKFGGPKNNYVSRLGELSKRSLKVKI